MNAGRTALVTGSVSGLGRAVADSLAMAGARVVVHGLPSELGSDTAREIAAAHNVEVCFEPADLSERIGVEDLVDRLTKRFGHIDIVVNNAVTRHFSPVDSFDPDAWDKSLAVNLTSAFHLARLLVPGMKRVGWGRIVNMASVYGFRGAENRIDYVTTKTALLGMTRALAIELAQNGITCNAICPGTVASPAILERISKIAVDQGISREEAAATYIATRHPTRRFVKAESVGAMVAFLCTSAGDDITGTSLPVDGGWLAA